MFVSLLLFLCLVCFVFGAMFCFCFVCVVSVVFVFCCLCCLFLLFGTRRVYQMGDNHIVNSVGKLIIAKYSKENRVATFW